MDYNGVSTIFLQIGDKDEEALICPIHIFNRFRYGL